MDYLHSKRKTNVDVASDLKHDDIEGEKDDSRKHEEQKEHSQQQKELKDHSKQKEIRKDPSNQTIHLGRSRHQETRKNRSQQQKTQKDRSQQQETQKERSPNNTDITLEEGEEGLSQGRKGLQDHSLQEVKDEQSQETQKGRSCFPFSLCGCRNGQKQDQETKELRGSERKLKQQEISENAFKQQQMWAFRPQEKCSPFIYIIMFITIGIIFIMVGVGLWFSSEQVHEVSLDYTQCTNSYGTPCSQLIKKKAKKASCECKITLDLGSVDWVGPVFIYYGLTNFYQNHRKYVESVDRKQLGGELDGVYDNKCEPFLFNESGSVVRFAPCGAIANSMFDDTIKLQYKKGSNDWTEVPLLNTGIAWQSDKDVLFKNPVVPENSSLESVFKEKNLASPKDWSREIWELDTENDDNNGFQNEDLIVWMRTAALSNFRKPYRRIDHKNEKNQANFEADFKKGLPTNGYKYRLVIDYAYDVGQFSGTKSLIVSAPSVFGGKNPLLGIAYMTAGCMYCIMSIPFIYIHLQRDEEGKRQSSAISIN